MQTLTPNRVADAVYQAIRMCATTLRLDYKQAIIDALSHSDSSDINNRSAQVLSTILENADIAAQDNVPICQDTGSVWVCLELGSELSVPGNIFCEVNDAVARAYIDGHLRMSMVKDALFDRNNTNNNTPAFCELRFVEGDRVVLHVLLKGGGSDNASRVVMLPPGAGEEGVIQAICECVQEKAANACPPLVIGVGVGATFDKVASLAKHALLRPIGSAPTHPEAALFEQQVLKRVNSLNIGPGALGGYPTAVAVHLETAACHIAALPVAINMGCCAMRSASITLIGDNAE